MQHITFLDTPKEITPPTGRQLTEEEDKKMWHFFKDYTWCSNISDNKIYFSPEDEDVENKDTATVIGYITIETLERLKIPTVSKTKKKPTPNPLLTNQKWYNNLMKKIK